MSLPLSVAILIIVLWTAGCSLLGYRFYAKREEGVLQTDQFLMLAALASLALAPWISLIVYLAGDQQTVLGGVINLVVAVFIFFAARRARKYRLHPNSVNEARASFRQKSALLMLCTLSATYIVYAMFTWQMPSLIAPLFLGAALVVAILATIGHTLLAIAHTPAGELNDLEDERDQNAELAGSRKAYLVLAIGMWVVPLVALCQWPALFVANAAFLFLVLSQVVKYAATALYYERGNAG